MSATATHTSLLASIRPALVGLSVLLLAWQALVWSGAVPERYLPGVVAVAQAATPLLGKASFWVNEGLTLLRAAGGLLLASITGVGLALLGARWPIITRALAPLVQVMLALPPAALVPLSIFALGLGAPLYAFIIWFAGFFVVYVRAENALAASEPVQVHAARSLGLGEWAILLRVRLPAAGPEIASGIRVTAAASLMATVATEMLAGGSGLGYMLVETAFTMRIPTLFALLAVAALNGALLNWAVLRWRRWWLGWHEQLAATAEH